MYNQKFPLVRQIRASAGSGKTYEITSSFLSFLTQVSDSSMSHQEAFNEYSWSGILAITFTNKAATEMKERIINRLKDTALGKTHAIPGWTKQQGLYWLSILLKNYSTLNIRTIDSLLHIIVRLTALELRLPPDFQPVFSIKEALSPLLDSILGQARYNQNIQKLLNETCMDIFFHQEHNKFMMGSILKDTILSKIFPFIFNTTQLAQPKIIAEKFNSYIHDLKTYALKLLECLESEKLLVDAKLLNFLKKCTSLPPYTLPPISTMVKKNSLDDCLLKSAKGTASYTAHTLYKELCTYVEKISTKGTLLKNSLSIMPYVKLAQEMHKHLPEFFRKQKILPASLIPLFVQQIFSGEYGISGTFCRLGSNLRHILIDEFQDTSNEQWQAIQPLAIEALSQGGSLTWVGDVKQAIYGWRNGNASLFDEIIQDPQIQAIVPYPQKDMLPTNWRSSRAIVTTNNSIFSKLAIQETVTKILSSLLPKNTPQHIKDIVIMEETSTIIHAFTNSGQSISPEKNEGYVFIQYIKEDIQSEPEHLIQKKLIDIIKEVSNRRSLGDIAVLVRKNEEAKQVAAWLINAGFGVVTENSFLLSEHPLIIQLTALLEFLDTPRNDLAFWTLVTGGTLLHPLFDITTQELHEWLCTRNQSQPIFLTFKHSFPSLWKQWLDPFYTEAGLLSPYDIIQEAILRFSIKKRFHKEMPFVMRFLEILHTASLQGISSTTGFLNHWKQYGHEEKTPMPENFNAVRVMTIHKSKGLQFPVVIIPWHNFSSKPNEKFLQIAVDGLEILTPKTKAIGKEYYKELTNKIHESLNLLYVAWTRAEEELYPILTSKKESTFSGAIFPLLEHLFKENDAYEIGEKLYKYSQAPHASEHKKKTEDPSNDILYSYDSLKPMHWLPQLHIFRSPLHELSFTNKRRGILLHYCLQHLYLSGDPKHDAIFAVEHGIKSFPLPLPTKEYATIKSEFVDMFIWYVGLPQTSHWMRFGTSEQSLLDGNNIYRADLIVNDGKEYTIIEYKTGQSSKNHKKQLQYYIDTIKKTTSLKVNGTLIYFDLKEIHTLGI